MTGQAEHLAPRETVIRVLTEAGAGSDRLIESIADDIETAGYSLVPHEWVPDAATLDDAAARLDWVRTQLTGQQQSEADTARRAMRGLTDLACVVLGLPERGQR